MNVIECRNNFERCTESRTAITASLQIATHDNVHAPTPLVQCVRLSATHTVRVQNRYNACKTRINVVLLIIFVIYFQTSAAVPVSRSGQRLLLHTRQSRERDHQLLIQQLRAQQPPNSLSQRHPHSHPHHLHLRSVPVAASSANMAVNANAKCQLCEYLQHAKCAVESTYSEMVSSLNKNEMKTFYNEAMGEKNSLLQFPVAHSYRDTLRKMNINDLYSLPVEDFSHLRRPCTVQQITDELIKVHGSMTAIRQVLDESLTFQEASLVQNSEPFKNNKDFEKISNWTREFLITDVVNKLNYLERAVGVEHEQYDVPRDQFNNIVVGVREYFRLLKFQKALYVVLGSHCESECMTGAHCKDSEQHI